MNRFLETIAICRASDTTTSRPPRRLEIYLLISNHPGSYRIDSELPRCFQDQSRLRFPTIAHLVRPMRAVVDTVNRAAESCEFLTELLVYLRHFKMSSKAASNHRLIRYYDYSEAYLLNLMKRAFNSRKNLELFGRFDKVGPF